MIRTSRLYNRVSFRRFPLASLTSTPQTEGHHEQPGQDDTYLYHHFDDLDQQHDSSSLGMWAFLATEVLFFGGVLGAFAIVTLLKEEEMAKASSHLIWWVGALNTGVLLCSSLTMALAVRASQLRNRRQSVWLLLATLVLGSAFLGVKVVEWSIDYHEGLVPTESLFNFAKYGGSEVLFWSFYFTLTGIHALHMVIGIVAIAITAGLVWRGSLTGTGSTQIEMLGLYWHFVDLVWVFLYPILYLIHL